MNITTTLNDDIENLLDQNELLCKVLASTVTEEQRNFMKEYDEVLTQSFNLHRDSLLQLYKNTNFLVENLFETYEPIKQSIRKRFKIKAISENIMSSDMFDALEIVYEIE